MTTPTSPASGAAPLQTIGDPPPSHVYRTDASRAALAITAACLLVVSEVAEAVIAFPASDQYIEADHTGRTSFSPDYTLGYSLVALLTFGMLVFAYVTTGLWLWRARLNAEVLVPNYTHRHGRGWVWGAWVAPILFLWFPFIVVSDIASATRDSEPPRPRARLVGFWWGTWLVYVVSVQISSRLVPWNGAPGAAAARALVWVEVISAVASAVALLFWIKVVRGIHTSQEQRAAQLYPAQVVELPPGVRRAGAGAAWAIVTVPICFVAAFLGLAAIVVTASYQATKEGFVEPASGQHAKDSSEGRATYLEDLEQGDCLDQEFAEGRMPESVNVVDCDARHLHEVYATFELAAGPFPGAKAVVARVERRCAALFGDYVGIPYERSKFEVFFLYPLDREAWTLDRSSVCLITGPTTSTSAQGSHR